jgi:carbamoyltransferase
MNVLGISALYHDSAAALCINGEIIAAAQEERFTRKKNDPGLPINAIKYCLQEGGLTPDKLDAVVYYDHPILTLDRFLKNLISLGGKGETEDLLNMSFDPMFKERIWVHEHIKDIIPSFFDKRGKLLVANHHISHAASAFYPSPFKTAAIITLDGVGEWATTTIGQGCGNQIDLLQEIDYPDSLGLFYSALSYFCGFKVNSGEYKFMGLAPYGEPLYYDTIMNNMIDVKKDGSYKLNLEYFDYYKGKTMSSDKFCTLFGGPKREFESEITKREMDIAASTQKVIEDIIILIAKHTKQITRERNLVMAGGVALNCVANGKLMREKIFDEIWVQPAAGDAGGALGAALYTSFQHLGVKRKIKPRGLQKGSYLGPKFTNQQINNFLNKKNCVYREYKDDSKLFRDLAMYLSEKKVIGFFNGRMEFGPRALGARSIIADPRHKDMQSKLNLKIKYRESFRPFAPSVLTEKACDYFEMDYESPFMLFVADVKKERRKPFLIREHITKNKVNLLPVVNIERSDIPAVTHVDYSARVQTVHRADNPNYYRLITEFENITGCAVIVNTSFNVRGEPIVCTPEEAYLCFMRTDMDILALENFVLFKTEQPEFTDKEDWGKSYELD